MDLIYADASRVDIGVLQRFDLDWESSTEADSNTFAISVYLQDNPLDIGYYIYIEDNEIGGVIDSVKIDTARATATYGGRTWSGVMASKVISPAPGEDYVIISGDANYILGQMIAKVDLQDLISASSVPSGVIINNYQFYRYVDFYSGIQKMLSDYGLKLQTRWTAGHVQIEAVPIAEHTDAAEISSDLFDFVIQKSRAGANHIIGLGRGELRDREVVHRFIDNNGNISNTQYYFGADEIVVTYENSNCESYADLVVETENKLQELSDSNKVDITANNIVADVGDLFTAKDIYTGLSITQKVTNKIAKISGGRIKYSYKVGDAK